MPVMWIKRLRAWRGPASKTPSSMRGLLLEKRIVSGSSSLQVSAPPVVWGTPETASHRKPDHQTIVRAFKSHLADYRLPDEVIEAYAMTFSHSGEFLLVRTANKRAEAASDILRNCGATRVGRHD